MSQQNTMFSALLKKEGGKLVYDTSAKRLLYQKFVDSLEEGQTVEIFLDANKDDGSLVQLAKVHKCIKEIAIETGATVDETKRTVKQKSGLCIKKEVDGEMYMIYKSFAKCSKEELSLAIQAIIEIGDQININFR